MKPAVIALAVSFPFFTLQTHQNAFAAEVIYSGAGVIEAVDDGDGNFEVDQAFTFEITIDTDLVSADGNPSPDAGIFAFPMGYTYQITVPDAGFGQDIGGNNISTFNDAGSSMIDSVSFNGNSTIITLRDEDGSVFGTDALPTTLPDLNQFEITTISYFPAGSLQNFSGVITSISVTSGNACPADIGPIGAPDGMLNFLDVSAFLSLYSNGDLAADFAPDGMLNFLDVSEFLAQYSSGCP